MNVIDASTQRHTDTGQLDASVHFATARPALPTAIRERLNVSLAANQSPSAFDHDEHLGSSRILVIDDSQVCLKLMCDRLAMTGCEVTSATHGNEGLAQLMNGGFHVAVIDVMMPELDGFEVCRRARAWANRHQIQMGLLILSANESRDVLLKALENGADDFVSKHQDMEIILAHVSSLTRRIRMQRKIDAMTHEAHSQEVALREAEWNQCQAEERARHAESRAAWCDKLAKIAHDLKVSEKDLQVAKETAETANRAKSQFLAHMSHEIRTPLNSILGFTELLRRGISEPDQHADHLETIHRSGRHLLRLIDDILDLSKIEAGHMEVDCRPCSPYEIVCEAVSILRVRAQEKSLHLDVRWEGAIPEAIQTDPVRVRQILMNVVGNAIKFTEQGGVTLTIRTVTATSESYLSIEVQDTGIGIPRDRLEQIFAPFAQADSSITRRFGGSGLGMAISREIARRLGGDITVDSEPGQGSRFHILLTTGSLAGVRLVDVAQEDTWWDADTQLRNPRPRLDGRRVLVVDDGESNRELIELLLTDAGADVVCRENGQDGLEAAISGSFDLILMDIQMPVLDGISATQAFRTHDRTTPVVALTAHAMRGDRESCLAGGFSDYLSKPIDLDELMHVVTQVLKPSARRPRAEPRVSAPQSPGGPAGEPEAIHSSLGVERPEIRQIVRRFMVKLSERLELCASSIDRPDLPAIEEIAHWLKGAGGTMGLDCFTEPARMLEAQAAAAEISALRLSLAELQSLAKRVVIPD